jgi:hypothetical protein
MDLSNILRLSRDDRRIYGKPWIFEGVSFPRKSASRSATWLGVVAPISESLSRHWAEDRPKV